MRRSTKHIMPYLIILFELITFRVTAVATNRRYIDHAVTELNKSTTIENKSEDEDLTPPLF